MNCPVCKTAMAEQDFGGVHVDVCSSGCKGIWFDWMELRKLNEKNEGLGEALQAALQHPRVNNGKRERLKCPKCQILLYAHESPMDKEINVDECYGCGGFFLDSGEFKQIRDRSMSEKEEQAYLTKLVEDRPESKALDQLAEKNRLRAEALAHYTRYVRLSYYVTGK